MPDWRRAQEKGAAVSPLPRNVGLTDALRSAPSMVDKGCLAKALAQTDATRFNAALTFSSSVPKRKEYVDEQAIYRGN